MGTVNETTSNNAPSTGILVQMGLMDLNLFLIAKLHPRQHRLAFHERNCGNLKPEARYAAKILFGLGGLADLYFF